MSRLTLTGATIETGDERLDGHALVIEGATISAIVPETKVGELDCARLDVSGMTLAPGLVDLQVNGGGDVLLNDAPTVDGVRQIARAHQTLGTTSLLPTLISSDAETRVAALKAVATALAEVVPGVLGVHVEGPWINPNRHGIHPPSAIRRMPYEDVDLLGSGAGRVLVTLAPELVEVALVQRLVERGIGVSAGHSEATPDDLHAAVGAGLRFVTHLFNAMSGFRGRAPGLVGAALADDRVACGIIADGHHVSPEALTVAVRSKRAGALFAVSDAMPPVGGRRNQYEIAGVEVRVEGGRCVSPDGVLAGSACSLLECVRTLVTSVAVPIDQALRMASTYPAILIGRGHEIGRIAPGYRADLIALDPELELRAVFVGGERVQGREAVGADAAPRAPTSSH